MRLVALLLLLFLPFPALAQSGPPQGTAPGSPAPRRVQMDMDTDRDGSVSREEFLAAHARAEQAFDKLDSNGDGAVSRDEFLAGGRSGQEQGRAERFRTLDSNSDGRITREELEARHNARFESLDTDHDGKLSGNEMRSVQNAMRRDALEPAAR